MFFVNILAKVLTIFVYINNIWCMSFDHKAIVNGFGRPIEPKQGEVPYQASLLAQINGSHLTFCGGSLIHRRWILTAGHCLEQDGKQLPTSLIKIAVGSVYTSLKDAQIYEAENIFINKGYFETGGNHDIGLIKLKEKVKLGRFIKLIKINTNEKESLIGQTAYLTGFGLSNDFNQQPKRLRKAILHVNTPDKCLMKPEDNTVQICCTSTIAEGKACKGDSGGPLVIIKSGRTYQIGITSHLALLPFCKITFNHSVYTKVAPFVSWISAVTGVNFYKYNI